jgi:hypothetical protein
MMPLFVHGIGPRRLVVVFLEQNKLLATSASGFLMFYQKQTLHISLVAGVSALSLRLIFMLIEI